MNAEALAAAFRGVSPLTLADILTRREVMDIGVRPIGSGAPRVAGPAYTVRCPPGDNLMLHAAIYRAPPGSIIVAEAGTNDFAVCGGNVCRVAQRRGIVAFVVDGVVRILAEIRAHAFPVFARGAIPIPGAKKALGALGGVVRCGGVEVSPGDVVVGDEEGICVVPSARAAEVLASARARAAKEATETLDAWEAAHREKIESLLRQVGFPG